jgi:chemotaxis protein MotB
MTEPTENETNTEGAPPNSDGPAVTEHRPKSGASNRLPWAIAAAAVLLSILVSVTGLLPAREAAERAQSEAKRLEGELDATKEAAETQRTAVESLLKDRDTLSQEASATKVRLEQAIAEREAALRELEQAKKELSETLGTQIAAGDVLIKEVKGELVVDVADKLLFDTGEADVNEAGQEFLQQVAKSMKRLPPNQIFQVGGHTDAQRVVSKELVERYPTNWELAAARATNVVRYLQETGRVPGRQLLAAAFSQYRPASTNKTEQGRQKNRRIEIVLLRKNH